MTENHFEQAIALTRSLYNSAALHLVAEDKNGVWVNRYTSVTYGREEDLRSVRRCLAQSAKNNPGPDFSASASGYRSKTRRILSPGPFAEACPSALTP